MRVSGVFRIALLAVVTAVAIVGCSTTPAGQPGPITAKSCSCNLVVSITNTGAVWGKVSVTYSAGGRLHTVPPLKECSYLCLYKTPPGQKLTLRESPIDTDTNNIWVFSKWAIANGRKATTARTRSVSFTALTGLATAKAIYVLSK